MSFESLPSPPTALELATLAAQRPPTIAAVPDQRDTGKVLIEVVPLSWYGEDKVHVRHTQFAKNFLSVKEVSLAVKLWLQFSLNGSPEC